MRFETALAVAERHGESCHIVSGDFSYEYHCWEDEVGNSHSLLLGMFKGPFHLSGLSKKEVDLLKYTKDWEVEFIDEETSS